MMENLLSSPLLYSLALTLIHFVWQGALVALALKIVLAITPYTKPQLRYSWASVAMVCNLVLPIITFHLIYQPEYKVLTEQLATPTLLQNVLVQGSNDVITWYQDALGILPYISMSWLVVVMLLASKLFIELYHVNRLPNVGTLAPNEQLAQRFDTLVNKIQLKQTPTLLISLKVEVPMALGWLKPVVLIPASMLTGLTPTQLDMLILHELAHIRRHDYLVNFMQTLVETLLFFHPAVRWVSKQMRNEREYCSDDIAVNIAGSPIAYARTLADTASLCQKHRHHSIPTMAMAASGGDLKQRVVRLVNQNHHCSNNDDSGKWLASVLIIFSVFAVAIKPYLSTTIIDFSSGRISLFHSASEYIKQQPTDNSTLSATSIAQRLLNTTPEETVITDPIAVIKTTSIAQPLQESSTTAVQLPKQIESAPVIIETSQPVIANKDTQAKKIDILVSNKSLTIVEQPNAKKELVGIDDAQITAALLVKSEKSISEQAFERTDSTKKSSKLDNPYAKQLADLTNEPIFTGKQKTINSFDLSRFNISYPVKKSAPVVLKKNSEKSSPVKTSAKLISSIDPRYPSTAKRKGLELDVAITFTIDKNGRVKNIEFKKRSKVNYFRNAVKAAMEKWRFTPAKVDGNPVESKMSKIFSFSLLK